MNTIVSDTTALIVLATQDRLDLLGACFERIPIPEALPHRKTEIIVWPLDADLEAPTPTLSPGRRRSPPTALAGKVREIGDVMSTITASDWGIDDGRLIAG